MAVAVAWGAAATRQRGGSPPPSPSHHIHYCYQWWISPSERGGTPCGSCGGGVGTGHGRGGGNPGRDVAERPRE
ncbi:hypothetical protein ACP70R_037792 [Stipagrostis hirtigluma subsp. patula]